MRDVARVIGCSYDALWRLAQTGQIPFTRDGSLYLFDPRHVGRIARALAKTKRGRPRKPKGS